MILQQEHHHYGVAQLDNMLIKSNVRGSSKPKPLNSAKNSSKNQQNSLRSNITNNGNNSLLNTRYNQ
jgi:hypothetical protein